MRKWMKDRLQRRKKKAPEEGSQPAPPPLQPAYFDADQAPTPVAHSEAQPEAFEPEHVESGHPEAESVDASEPLPSSRRDSANSGGQPRQQGARREGQGGRGRRRRGGRGRGGRSREQAVTWRSARLRRRELFLTCPLKQLKKDPRNLSKVKSLKSKLRRKRPELRLLFPRLRRARRRVLSCLPLACPDPARVPGSSGTRSFHFQATWFGRFFLTMFGNSVFRISYFRTCVPC